MHQAQLSTREDARCHTTSRIKLTLVQKVIVDCCELYRHLCRLWAMRLQTGVGAMHSFGQVELEKPTNCIDTQWIWVTELQRLGVPIGLLARGHLTNASSTNPFNLHFTSIQATVQCSLCCRWNMKVNRLQISENLNFRLWWKCHIWGGKGRETKRMSLQDLVCPHDMCSLDLSESCRSDIRNHHHVFFFLSFIDPKNSSLMKPTFLKQQRHSCLSSGPFSRFVSDHFQCPWSVLGWAVVSPKCKIDREN
jgi:hypothetical protein